jgi:hypothetical protein
VPSATYKRRSRSTRSGLELPRTDGRTLAARRFRALYLAFENELGRREVSTRRRQRCRAHPPPSSPILQACSSIAEPSVSKLSLNRMSVCVRILRSTALRSNSGASRRSKPLR